jgi:hypothetical protein
MAWVLKTAITLLGLCLLHLDVLYLDNFTAKWDERWRSVSCAAKGRHLET